MIKDMILCTRGNKTIHDERIPDEMIDRVIILDRMTDPYTMFLTPMNYEGLIDAWLNTNHGEVFYPSAATENCSSKSTSTDSKSTDDSQTSRQNEEFVTSKAILSHLDPIHLALRDTNFNIVLSDKIGHRTNAV
uniref:AlNc14C193G8499 protein n=1 Tax=Albugo laibachii Nc14 TaxID=890382 RepID=F0WQ17_9STRA|nr:AlNc14C193G8499 [Albugo laibachii Nc14]|eukprot:CCA23422.1 AlNc14C193G8499 [Albugo laibachii Nc14]